MWYHIQTFRALHICFYIIKIDLACLVFFALCQVTVIHEQPCLYLPDLHLSTTGHVLRLLKVKVLTVRVDTQWTLNVLVDVHQRGKGWLTFN